MGNFQVSNRMGLEQALSDEQLEAMIGGLIMSKIAAQQTQSFTPSFAEQNELQIAALRELLAYRKASKVAVADAVAWNKPGEERKCDIRWRRFDVAPGPLYEAPPLQAVTVPDAIEPDYDVIKGILPTSNPDEYACCIAADMWNTCRNAMLKSVTNEP